MEIKELHKGPWKARINPSRGANCISLRHSGYGLRILREPCYEAGLDNPYLYGMPVLFPVNRIAGGRFVLEGREYTFPLNEPQTGCHLHGDLHEAPFTVTSESEDRITCTHSREARAGFPHAFTVEITYRLTDAGLRQETRILNRSDTAMPVLLGYHTTFDVCGIGRELRVLAEVGDYVEREMQTYLPTGRLLPPDAITQALNTSDFRTCETPISRHYRAAGQGRMAIGDVERGVTVLYENDAKFPFRLIYNGDGTQYICLEPQTCAVDCANAPYPAGYAPVPCIPPHSAQVFWSSITLQI